MPEMPVVSAPTIGGSFYIPGSSSSGSTSGSSSATGTSDAAGTETGETTAPVTSPTPPAAATAATAATSSENTSGINGVTAADLKTLDKEGLLSNLSSLLGITPSVGPSGSNTSQSLNKILEQLNELKTENKAPGAADTQSSAKNTPLPAAADETTGKPTILRFLINGYDVRATCRTIYFSDRSTDGTFLLTGDRKYISDGKTRTETFYLLFKADGSRGFCTDYDVQPAVIQDAQNIYSFLYQLSQKKKLTATKTGNLVTMRVTEPSWNMDLLLDITGRNENQ